MKLLFAVAFLGLLPGASLLSPAALPRLASPGASALAPAPDSTTVRLHYGAENAELDELLGRVLGVEKHHLVFQDRRLAGRHLHFTLQEYQRGVPGPEKPLSSDNSLTQLDSAGRYQFTIYSRQKTDNQAENMFVLPRAYMPRRFSTSPGQVGSYSLRFDIHALRRAADQAGGTPASPVQAFRLPLGTPAIFAVYTPPYEKEGMYYYCNLAQSRVPVADWYAKFKVPHFVVYRVRVE